MRRLVLFLALFTSCSPLGFSKDRPVVSTANAKQYEKAFATVYGRVIEIRRIYKGPLIFTMDGRPGSPAFQVFVYPMAVERFGSAPEKLYLGQVVETTGQVLVRNDRPQMWINDPSSIKKASSEQVE